MSKAEYFLNIPDCECCGRSFETVPVGEISQGYEFVFYAYPDRQLQSWQDWKTLIEAHRNGLHNSADQLVDLDVFEQVITRCDHEIERGDYHDGEGFAFCRR